MGRKRKPPAIRRLEGRDAREDMGQVPADKVLDVRGPCPPTPRVSANAAALKEWAAITSALAGVRLLGPLDVRVVESWCLCCAAIDAAYDLVQKVGTLTVNARGNVGQHPAQIQWMQLKAEQRALMGRLGLSPADRAGLKMPEAADELDEFGRELAS